MDRKKSFETNMTDISHGIRPSDVPGRILNIALVNIGSENYTLRSQAYNLLCSLCLSFRFGVDNKLMNAKGKQKNIQLFFFFYLIYFWFRFIDPFQQHKFHCQY